MGECKDVSHTPEVDLIFKLLIMTWKYLLKKEFRQFLRDPGMPRMVMTFPFLIVLVFPFAASMEVKNIRLAVVDNDHSDYSSLLVEKCTNSG